jgi:hypothetical protein
MNQNLLHFTDDCIVVAVGRLPKSVDVTSLYFFGGKEAPRPKPGRGAEFTQFLRAARTPWRDTRENPGIGVLMTPSEGE